MIKEININDYYIEIAGIKIKIKKSNAVSDAIIEDLNAVAKAEDNYDIYIEIIEEKLKGYKAKIFSAKGSMNFNESTYFVDYLPNVNYYIENLFNNKSVQLYINSNKSNLKTKLKSYYSSKRIMAKNTILSYSLFWYVFHIVLLRNKKSFLHAGVVDINGMATIITGTGGCGKTSTLFKILEEKDNKYLAEDFGIIDSTAFTYYNPKPVSIYASDMEFGQSLLTNYFTQFSIKEKFLWSLKRNFLKINPMIKARPDILMDNKISKKIKIKNVIYFVRTNDTKITIKNININDLTERVLDASMRELKTFNELVLLIKANAPVQYNIPSFEDIRMQTKSIYEKAFEQTNNKIIYIPHKTKPNDLVDYLKNAGLV
jgi:hypothetical protein